MKSLIIALNSRYIHSSLSVWYLKANCGDECGDTKVLEFTINNNPDRVLAEIFAHNADVAAFSCYIWNISYILKLTENLKKISPKTTIILGGPEVSFDAKELVNNFQYIDYILTGEGDRTFQYLLRHINSPLAEIEEIKGFVCRYRVKRECQPETYQVVENLDSIKSPYSDEMLASIKNRIVYFESSRGCPFSCTYCLSSTCQGVRYFPMERVRNELLKLMDANVKQIKFVDRTFNSNTQRAKDIFRFIIEQHSKRKNIERFINFHFEIAADLLDDEMLQILSQAPAGLIQFEAGVQTTNERTLEAVNRKTDLERLFYNIEKLISSKNIHIHLDLIAGLPYEDFNSFSKSFNWVYGLKPHHLQLGFLKMLKGSKIREDVGIYEYRFRRYPPYEVLRSKYLRYDDVVKLKGIEQIVERCYNSGRFVFSLDYVINSFFESAFHFYHEFYNHNAVHMGTGGALSGNEVYELFVDFVKDRLPSNEHTIVNDLLKFDFLRSNNTKNLPYGINRVTLPGFKEKCFNFLKDSHNIKKHLPGYEDVSAKQIYKQVHFEVFDYDVSQISIDKKTGNKTTVIIFNYKKKDKVTGLYHHFCVAI